MGNLFVFVAASIYGIGLALIGAIPVSLIVLWAMNKYCLKNFGESLFWKGDEA